MTAGTDVAAALLAAQQAFAAKDFATALAYAQQVVAVRADEASALALIANAALALDRLDDAVAALERLALSMPQHTAVQATLAATHNRAGARAHRRGEATQAQAHYDRALALAPDHVEALFNRARLALDARHPAVALPDLRRAAILQPADAGIALLLAETELATGRLDALIAIRQTLGHANRGRDERLRLARALADGGDADGALTEVRALREWRDFTPGLAVAQRLAENGAGDAARSAYAHLAALGDDGRRAPSLHAWLGSRLALPAVYETAAHLQRERARFIDATGALAADMPVAAVAQGERALEQLQWSNYLLAYQGEVDRAPLSRYGDWLAGAAAALAPEFAVPPPRATHARPRIGLLSSAFCHSSVAAYFGTWPRALRDAGFDVRLFQLGTVDNQTAALARDADQLVRLDGTLTAIATRIRGHDLDLLLYPDLGVDPRLLVLGALRLARRQVTAWGLPNTTGLPTIDAFITCAAMEPADAPAHYREPLLTLPGIGTRYRRPALPSSTTREAVGLPSGNLYLVPQIPAKLHPALDAVCARIAALDDDARLVFFAGSAPGATRILHHRLETALQETGVDPHRRIVMLQPDRRSRFLQVCQACDVMVDTHHWSGGNTTIDALLCGLPVVAWPGALMRGRQSQAMLRQIGLAGELIVADGEAQARRAVDIATDGARRAAISDRIAAALPALLDDEAPLRALVAHLHDLLA